MSILRVYFPTQKGATMMLPPKLSLGLPQEFRREAELAVAETRRRSQLIQKLRKVEDQLPAPWHRVRRYNKWRMDLLTRRLTEAGQAFCTLCRNTKELGKLKEVLVAGRRLESFELITTRNPAVRYYVELHRLCEICLQGAQQAAPTRQPAGGSRELNGCWQAMEQNGRWHYEEDGWWPVPPEAKAIPTVTASHLTMPSRKVVVLEDQWQVPVELFFDLSFGVYTCNEHGKPVLLA